MPAAELPRPLRGIIPPLATPLLDRDRLDVAGLERLVEHVLGGGVQGLFLLGTTGEGPSLGYRLRCELVERVCELVAGRVPVLAGVTDTSLVESLNLVDVAADAGAQAVVMATPCYYPLSQAELQRYVEQMAAESPLPVFLYNIPSHTKLAFEPATLERLIEVPNVVGLKDSSADMIYFQAVRRLGQERADWTLLIGPEELLAEAILLGADGGVCGGANLWPRLYVELYEAARRGELVRVSQLHAQVMRVHEGIYTIAPGSTGVIAGLKCALCCLGICSDVTAGPMARLAEAGRQTIREHVAELRALLEVPGAARRV